MGKHVLLIGAGHAHLYTLKQAARFRDRGHELVAVSPDRFWYSGLATGMLGGAYPPELDQVDVAALAARGGGRFVAGGAARIDPPGRRVHLEDGAVLNYDALSLNLGSAPPEIPADTQAGIYAVKPVRRLYDLRLELERRFLSAPDRRVRVVVAGGGVTGCELAANIAALARARAGRVAVTVLTAGAEVLMQLPSGARRSLLGALARRGIAIRCHARVLRIAKGAAVLKSGAEVPFDLLLNATGLRPNPLVRETGLPVDAAGALRVDARLRSIADPSVHGGGDCIAFGGGLPKIGVHAIRQAPVLCHNLAASLDGSTPREFTPQARYLWIMNLGEGDGFAVRGGLWWHGRSAFWLKDRIDRRFLQQYQAPEAG